VGYIFVADVMGLSSFI